MSGLFGGDLWCGVCWNLLKPTKNKKGEKVFYCRTCGEYMPIPKEKNYLFNKKLNNVVKDIVEVPVVENSKDQYQYKEHRNYWDLGHTDM